MKRFLSFLLAIVVMVSIAAFAEIPAIDTLTDEELAELAVAIEQEQQSRSATAEESAEVEVAQDIILQKGSKGDDVKKLQQRLIELNYLSGGADGDFGGKTEAALKVFQSACGLTADGVANAAVLEKLYAADAPKAKVYQALNFKEISRDPETYKGQDYKFSGKVLQVMEGSSLYGTTTTVLRIATRKNYDDVVYVTYERPNSDKRILEDDRVTVYGVCEGLHTYETIMGGSVTLPKFTAETISFD